MATNLHIPFPRFAAKRLPTTSAWLTTHRRNNPADRTESHTQPPIAMAKKKKSTTVTADAVPASDSEVKKAQEADDDDEEGGSDDDDDESEIELLQVDVGDVVKLKQILDETVAGTLTDKCKLTEDHTVDNVKLSVMTLACLFAMVAQFAPIPFPDSRLVLGGCCALYFVLSGVLQLVTVLWDKDCIMVTKPEEKAKNAKNKDTEKFGMRIRTCLPRFSEFYTVIIEFQGGEKHKFVRATWSVGKFFDVEGMFDEYGLEDEIEALNERFQAGKFDDKKDYIDDKLTIPLLLGLTSGPVPTPTVSKSKKEQ